MNLSIIYQQILQLMKLLTRLISWRLQETNWRSWQQSYNKIVRYFIYLSGAADSATGTQSGNQDLGKRRAKFIAKALIKRGVDKSQIKAYNLGGIDKYAANEANRFTTVVLLK